MKKLTVFHFASCPYCRDALRWVDELQQEHPELQQVEVERIDEKLEPERIKGYQYWFVPTFYLGNQKLHEGAATKQIVENILRQTLKA